MITQKINLNLIPGGVLPRVNVSQYDFGSRTLEITLYNGSQLFSIPTGSRVYIQGTKLDGRGFQYENVPYSGSVVTASITQQMTIFEDEVQVEVVIVSSDDAQQLATANFILNVEPAALRDDVVVSETDIPVIQTLPEAMSEVREAVQDTDQWSEDAEAWAVGTRKGTPVEEGDPTYHNNSAYWAEVSSNQTLHGLNDVSVPNPQDTQGLIFEASSGLWKAKDVAAKMSELKDATITSPAANQMLNYDGSKWINISLDSTPTANSNKPVTSDGLKTALDAKQNANTAINTSNIGSQSVNYANSARSATNASNATYASRAAGCETLSASGGSHGTAWLMTARHNLAGDGRFKIYCGDGSVGTRVDYATNCDSAGYATSAGSAGSATNANYANSAGSVNSVDGGAFNVSAQYTFVNSYGFNFKNAQGSFVQASAYAFNEMSSGRYKKNIETMSDADGYKLLALRPVIFDYLTDEDGTNHNGFIAEEVGLVETDPISYDEDGKAEALDYSKFTPQLVKLCQLQQERIEQLETDVAELKSIVMGGK